MIILGKESSTDVRPCASFVYQFIWFTFYYTLNITVLFVCFHTAMVTDSPHLPPQKKTKHAINTALFFRFSIDILIILLL